MDDGIRWPDGSQSALIVDDEVTVARAMARWLRRQGFQVHVLTDSAHFEAALVKERPSIVVCDYRMPGHSGVELLVLAKRLWPAARRCLISGSLSLLTDGERVQIEPCLFIDKPWDPVALATLLKA